MRGKPHLAILGTGPTGLEAALAAAEGGHAFTLYEAAPTVAGHVREWGHVRLFTPWSMNVSARARRILTAAGRPPRDDTTCPTGRELAEGLLEPIAELPQVRDHLRLGERVHRIGRHGLLKHEEIGTGERARRRFRLLVADAEGGQRVDEADAVLDCTGNPVPNALGDGGIPAPGEEELDDAIVHRMPDLAREAEGWAGKTTLLVGAGHSGRTALRDLVRLAEDAPGTRVIWALRDSAPEGPAADDPLPERTALITTAARLAADPPPCLEIRRDVVVDALSRQGARVEVTLRHHDGATATVTVDRILALTGQVGDDRIYRQLQVHECYATSGPMKLAAALMGADGGSGDCLQQTSQGADTLINPEPGFFILGSKSYGRRNDFLMRVGWQQVDEVFSLLGQ